MENKMRTALGSLGGLGLATALLFCLSSGMASTVNGAELDVKQDDQKTVYTVGPSDRGRNEEARDKERAWEMLRNSNIIMDRRTPQPQPAPAPAPAK